MHCQQALDSWKGLFHIKLVYIFFHPGNEIEVAPKPPMSAHDHGLLLPRLFVPLKSEFGKIQKRILFVISDPQILQCQKNANSEKVLFAMTA